MNVKLSAAGAALAIVLPVTAWAQSAQSPAGQAALPRGGARGDRVEHPVAEFAGLDKITGRIIKFEVRIGETVQFGALQVTPRSCVQRLTGDQGNVGFVEVDEITLRNEIRRLFSGWMFATSPGLNAVEHPIYDVWLDNCRGGNLPATAQAPAAGGPVEGEPPVEAPPPRRRSPAPSQQQRPAQGIQPGVPFDPSQLQRR